LQNLVFMSRSTSFKLVLTGFVLGVLLGSGLAQARGPVVTNPVATIALAELPRPGAQVYGLIRQGGPFAHEKDGMVFGNRERLLPAEKRGYYREYTVATPNSRDRGARRIVCGGQVKAPDNCYYTGDHYASFRRIVP
jgi:ribonuclease T1